MIEPFTALIYGEPGVGKTPVSLTVPAPRLVLDVEGGSRYVDLGRKIQWNPRAEQPPEEGDWDSCIVSVPDLVTMQAVCDYLRAGSHCFRSITVDNVSELQAKLRRSLVTKAGKERATEQIWGDLLEEMTALLGDVKDSTMHPENPVEFVIFTAHAAYRDKKMRPDVQGQLSRKLPGMVDLLGYLYAEEDEDGEPSADPSARRLLVQPFGEFVAKDRTSSLPSGGISGIHGTTVTGPLDIAALVRSIREGDN